MRDNLRNQRGFTLIELMIVILIVAILVAIAVPVFLSARTNAQKRTCQSNLRTIDGAINTYNAEYGYYPGNATIEAAMVPTMIKRIPTCPAVDSGVSGSANTYTLVGGSTASQSFVSCPGPIGGHSL
jgi:prepilin-type N-terminal cleavage/methylation domain-containing protein